MTIRLHPAAVREINDAVDWYEAQRIGLGIDFLRQVSNALDLIAEFPGTWPVWPGGRSRPQVRRFVLNRFPYSIAYLLRKDEILILAVGHSRRKPRYWRHRR